MQPMPTKTVIATRTWTPPNTEDFSLEDLRARVRAYLDTATTAFGRATHYNTREETEAAEQRAHSDLFKMDRGLYTAFATLPGLTDRSRQICIHQLQSHTRVGGEQWLTAEVERTTITRLLASLPPQRMLKLFESFIGRSKSGVRGVNNNRTRKLILRTLFASPRLDFWALKYRNRMARVLTHAIGQRSASIVRAILSKIPEVRTARESKILREELARFRGQGGLEPSALYEAVGFALGATRKDYSVRWFRKFEAAKLDLAAGQGLPLEVLEGLRSQFHPNIEPAEVLRQSAKTMSRGQRMAHQRRAEQAGVAIEWNPADHNAVKLYKYAFERGLTPEIEETLDHRARQSAQTLPLRLGRIAVLVDCSRSMFGSREHKLHPMAVALAIRDTLRAASQHAHLFHVGSDPGAQTGARLPRPKGPTSLARPLIEAVRTAPDSIFVISDGYENSPAGQTASVIAEMQQMGIQAPIFHLNPVVAAESCGVRELAPGRVPTLPVSGPEMLGMAMLRGLVDQNPIAGVHALLQLTELGPALKEATHHDHSHRRDPGPS